jgi:hypothetical protein
MTETLRDKLIRCGWVTNFNADTLVRLIERHYDALAQLEPQRPSDEELTEMWTEQYGIGSVTMTFVEFKHAIRDALARWGRPAIEPELSETALPPDGFVEVDHD